MLPKKIKENDFRYQFPSDEWLITYKRRIEEFINVCKNTMDDLGKLDIEINYLMLANIFIRINERADYFLYFHSRVDSMHMSCDKEVALLAFWIVKYKPFRIKGMSEEEQFYEDHGCSINEMLAALLMVFYICKKVPKMNKYFSEKKLRTLVYDLTNRDISKEALIMYVDSFIPSP